MRLNRNSGIVRWYLFVTFNHSEEAKQKALAEATNLCAFVQGIAIWTIVWIMIGALLVVCVPCGWTITAFMIMGGVTVGFIPVGWNAYEGREDRFARVMFPAVAFQWKRKLGIRIGARILFPNHVWGTALAVLSIWALAYWETAGWSRDTIPVAWIIIHGVAFMVAVGVIAYVLRAKWRNTEGWRVFRAWLRAKKDRVCPRIEFVDS